MGSTLAPVETVPSDPEGRRGIWFCSTLSTHLSLHAHVGPELNLLMCGELSYQLGQKEQRVQAGQLLVIEAGLSHQILSASEDAAFWVIELDPGTQVPWLGSSGTYFTDDEWLRSFVATVKKLWLRPSAFVEHSLWRALGEHLHAGPPDGVLRDLRPHEAVARARAVCRSSSEAELDMTTLAKQSGISPSRLSHLFQEELGITPLQYRNFCRIQQFISRYGEGDANLMRVALRSGFGSYPQFHRAFQQVCGAPPGAHLGRLLRDAWMKPSRTLPSQPTL